MFNKRPNVLPTSSWLLASVGAGVVVATAALATPPAGVVSNVMLAQGATVSALKENIAVGDDWTVNLEGKGQSEFFFQDLVIGRSPKAPNRITYPTLALVTRAC
jgi:hypothetical protein